MASRRTRLSIYAAAVQTIIVASAASTALAVLTPEQRANPATGQIPNPNAQEYYLGPIAAGSFTSGEIVGAVSGTLPSLVWYKYTSDGNSAILFDMFGSVFGFGGGGVFSGGPDGELALYDSQGRFIASNQGVRTPASGDSILPPLVPSGAPPAPVQYRQPRDPGRPVYEYSQLQSTWFARNSQNLPQLIFTDRAESNPLWDPAHPNHDPYADWNQYAKLPAGEYFLAVTGYSTYFAGNPRDIAIAGDDTTNPFGFVSYHAQTGTYVLNARLPGDMNLDGAVNQADLDLLQAKVAEFAPTQGVPPQGYYEGAWLRLPADLSDPNSELQRFDLTGNSRIDDYDLLAFSRYTGIAVTIGSAWNVDADGDWSAASNWTGQVPNAVGAIANFGTIITAARTVMVDAPATVATINFSSPIAYTIAGSSTITLDANIGQAGINVTAGSHVISAPLALAEDTTVNVAGGAALAVQQLRGQKLTLGAGTLRIIANPAANAPNGTSRLTALTIASGARLDLNNNSLIVESGSLSAVSASLKSALENGGAFDWQGPGIGSTQAAAQNAAAGSFLYGLGVILNDLAQVGGSGPIYTDFAGVSGLVGNAVLVKFTYFGDADLSGSIDATDYSLIDNGYVNSLSGWLNGDFDYSGAIDATDYALIDNAYVNQSGALGAALIAEHTRLFGGRYLAALQAIRSGMIPEPASAVPLAMAGIGVFSFGKAPRRRRFRFGSDGSRAR